MSSQYGGCSSGLWQQEGARIMPEFKDYRVTFKTKYMNKWQNWYIDITAYSEEDAIQSVQKAWYRGHNNHTYGMKAKEKHPLDGWCGYFKEYYIH